MDRVPVVCKDANGRCILITFMKTKQVTRYHCDFCKKSSGRKDAMERHERICFSNPNRKCPICEGRQDDQPELSVLVNYINEHSCFEEQSCDSDEQRAKTMQKLRELADDCPCCISAALCQCEAPSYWFVDLFDYEKELQAAWEEIRQSELDNMPPACFGGFE